MTSAGAPWVLTIGLHPRVLDYTKFPGLDEATLTARADASSAAIREAGFNTERCRIGMSPDEAEAEIRTLMAARSFNVVMIAAGLRTNLDYALLLERVVNVVTELAPGIRFCFNTSPEDTIDAVQRWVSPVSST